MVSFRDNLFWYCRHSYTRALEKEFKEGVDPDTHNDEGESLLWIAADHGQVDSVYAILSALEKTYGDQFDKFSAALNFSRNGLTIVERLRQQGLNKPADKIDDRMQRAIHKNNGDIDRFYDACASGDEAMIKSLLAKGVSADQRESDRGSAFRVAAKNGRGNIGTILLDELRKKHSTKISELANAVRWDGLPYAEELFRKSGHIELADEIHQIVYEYHLSYLEPYTFLDACKEGDLKVINDYLERGFNPDYPSLDGSPLWRAAHHGQEAVGELILAALKKKYSNQPAALVEALEVRQKLGVGFHAKYTTAEIEFRTKEAVKLANDIKATKDAAIIEVDSRRNRSSSARTDEAMPVETESDRDISPLFRRDSTLTATRLLEVNRGRAYIQTLGDQGLLAEIFTFEIWRGRRDEMEKLWDHVPNFQRDQVDIETVRGQIAQDIEMARGRLAQTRVRDRFGVRPDGVWGKGF